MQRSGAFGLLGLALAATFFLVGCEEHRAKAVSSAPEVQHDALSGKVSAQAWLAGCYAAGGKCIGVAPDPALACAWRGVRLVSRSPELSLVDDDALEAACALPDETDRQRAAVAMADLGARIYGRAAGDWMAGGKLPKAAPVLYPSMETVRARVNLALLNAKRSERLPPYGAVATEPHDGLIVWSTCAGGVCLEGQTLAFGGGVASYRVNIRTAGMDPREAMRLAGELAAAGLDSPSVAEPLGGPEGREFVQGPVCWRSGQGSGGLFYAAASPAPCLSH